MSLLFLLKLALAYLLGSLSGALLLGRRRGVDVRTHGSGNAGGTNALRVLGWRFALGVVAIDIAKGALATAIGSWHADDVALESAACAFAAVVGHCWPVFFGFRGGKGAATAAGAVLVLAPVLVAPLLIVWLVVLLATGYVGLATVCAGLAFPLAAFGARAFGRAMPSAFVAFAMAIAALILFTHRANLRRLALGSEPRVDRSRWMNRWRRST